MERKNERGREKIALITGVTGQDGAYLSDLLLGKGYEVHGLKRRSSSMNTARIDHLYDGCDRFFLHYGDMADGGGLLRLIDRVRPTEIYNLAAQSHVKVSFELPEYTADINALGALRLLEAIQLLGMGDRVRFYQASTSELYGQAAECPQNEETPFRPRSPYGIAKLHAFWTTVNYREAYGFHASNGILFNHDSPIRGETFVTRKITRGVVAIHLGDMRPISLGNLNARRDWGHARDYADGMWRILQQSAPDDYVLATGESRTVREFVTEAFRVIGRTIVWEGEGLEETGVDDSDGTCLIQIDPRYFRPAEVDLLEGDPAKARKRLNWRHTVRFEELVEEMVLADMRTANRGPAMAMPQALPV
ncbi:GDP-mannose 4,6-dehydratase [Inquilinus sp. CAU 1745]|uniref:GDP-mannose 4,6-dehydratase n=1 Tax=Inquilinus sp. CAU 1745 TaxID=3140369 RepID=UPI00325BBF1C